MFLSAGRQPGERIEEKPPAARKLIILHSDFCNLHSYKSSFVKKGWFVEKWR